MAGVRALLGAAVVAATLAAGCATAVPSSNAAQPDPGLPARLVAATTGAGYDGRMPQMTAVQRALGDPD